MAASLKHVFHRFQLKVWEQQLRNLAIRDRNLLVFAQKMANLVQDDVPLVKAVGPLLVEDEIGRGHRNPDT